jgi:UDP-2,3-diacylglucosamine pyrophosphatase LpxH
MSEVSSHIVDNDYGNPTVTLESAGRDIFVISDLHVAAGKSNDGRYAGTENFYSDDALSRWLSYCHEQVAGPAILIINGDFIDFIRIDDFPVYPSEFAEWRKVLQKLGIEKTKEELEASISRKEKEYGLKTDDYKSVWKLQKAVSGHPLIFDALAEWLNRGHELWIVKGNHDLEWYWPRVRNYLKLVLSERVGYAHSVYAGETSEEVIPDSIRFFDHSLLIDGSIYIEHGHSYDKFSNVVGNAIWGKGTELNIPFGSFFNRYLLNRIELSYPFLDNVRPAQNILPLLIRERFPLALQFLFHHIPFLVRIIPKNYYAYMLQRVVPVLLAVVLPAILVIYSLSQYVGPARIQLKVPSFLLSGALNLMGMVLSYFLARIVAFMQLKEPNDLSAAAQELFDQNPALRKVIFGHTHHPTQFRNGEKWFFNTGTWITVVENSTAAILPDKTFVFLHIPGEARRSDATPNLQRWNDDALRAESLVLINKK